VVVDAPEVERGAEAREVAGVGRRVCALPLDDRQAEEEGVARERGVHVEVAEQDLLVGHRAGARPRSREVPGVGLSAREVPNRAFGARLGGHAAGVLKLSEQASRDSPADEEHDSDQDRERREQTEHYP
jgi:hypothetical protein